MISEATRERQAVEYSGHLAYVAHDAAPFGSGPRNGGSPSTSSFDSILTAFAQLGTFKLDGVRCLISLFTHDRQFVVAEATRDSAISPGTQNPGHLWLGGTVIPRSFGVCDHVLVAGAHSPAGTHTSAEPSQPPPSHLPISVIPDLAEDDRFRDRPYILNPPFNRFYAGIPIRDAQGINIGVYCVFDDKPRNSPLAQSQVVFLQDISRTIMNHLEVKRHVDRHRRTQS